MRNHCYNVLKEQKINEVYLKLIQGDITNIGSSAIACSVDSELTNIPPNTHELLLRAGPRATYSLLDSYKSPLNLGQIIATLAGNLPSNYIFHVCTSIKHYISPDNTLRIFILKCLEMCDEMNIGTISIPVLSNEFSEISSEDFINLYFDVSQAYLKARSETIIKEIKFIISEKEFLLKQPSFINPKPFLVSQKKAENQPNNIELK